MIDYFALLELPRLPYLEQTSLAECFHRLARRYHPDLHADEPGKLTAVNEAFSTLQEPAARLKHLLALEGQSPKAGGEISDYIELFARAATAAEESRQLLRSPPGSSAITRSLAEAKRLQIVQKLRNVLAELDKEYGVNLRQLEALNQVWHRDRRAALRDIAVLQSHFSFLQRWRATLEELLFQLEH